MAFGGRSKLNMSEETFDFVCTNCARNNKTMEAKKYCIECGSYCCKACVQTHKTFPLLENHNLLGVNQGSQATGQSSRLPEFPTERCSIHKGKIVDMYCEDHDVVGCYACIVKDHKSCQESRIHSVPDMIDTIFNLTDCQIAYNVLKDGIVSTQTISSSIDSQLQQLVIEKKKVLDKINAYQKTLEAIIRKKADNSRNAVEMAYKILEKGFQSDKQTVDRIRGDLQTSDDKLKQSKGNRAQRFVCTNLAAVQMKDAELEVVNIKQKKGAEVSFVENQSLTEYFKTLHGIGQVQVQKYGKEKVGLYRMKGSKDINIRVSDDYHNCCSHGCCLMHDNQLLVTDSNNQKLKCIDLQTMSIMDYCTLGQPIYGVCRISEYEVAVACESDNRIQFVSIRTKMTPTRHIKMSHKGYGIAFKADMLYVTDDSNSLYVYHITGTLLKTISQDEAGNQLFTYSRHIAFNEYGNKIVVVDWNNGVVCLDMMGNYQSTIKDSAIDFASGVCVDGRGNFFVDGFIPNNVMQFSENGKKIGAIPKEENETKRPLSMSYDRKLKRLFVSMETSNTLKMYKLE